MRLGDLKLGKEGLARLPLPPVIAIEHLLRIVGEIVVRLALLDRLATADRARCRRVGDKPARLTQQAWQMLIRRGQRLRLLHIMRMQPSGGLIAAENEGRARGAAHGGCRISASVATPFCGETVQVGRADLRQSMGTRVGRHVIRDDPNEIG